MRRWVRYEKFSKNLPRILCAGVWLSGALAQNKPAGFRPVNRGQGVRFDCSGYGPTIPFGGKRTRRRLQRVSNGCKRP